jgi:hypothetical protein
MTPWVVPRLGVEVDGRQKVGKRAQNDAHQPETISTENPLPQGSQTRILAVPIGVSAFTRQRSASYIPDHERRHQRRSACSRLTERFPDTRLNYTRPGFDDDPAVLVVVEVDPQRSRGGRHELANLRRA